MPPKIGVQAMMLRDYVRDHGVWDAMSKVADLGYSAVEISQIPTTPQNIADLERAQNELGIDVASMSASYLPAPAQDSVTQDVDKIVENCQRLNTTFLRIGMAPVQYFTDIQQVNEFCAGVDDAAVKLAEHGVRLYYHNHHVEYGQIDGRFLLDIIYDAAPNLGLQVDVHWVQRGGDDPVRALRRYAERTELVHLKDYRIANVTPEQIAARDAGDNEAWAEFWRELVQFAEVGEGSLDFPSIIETSKEIGAKYLFVEQDRFYGRSVFDCLKTSRENLVAMGYGDLF